MPKRPWKVRGAGSPPAADQQDQLLVQLERFSVRTLRSGSARSPHLQCVSFGLNNTFDEVYGSCRRIHRIPPRK
jgi:hypothetical protein